MSVNIFALVIVLGVLIFFHELGHFLVARAAGCRGGDIFTRLWSKNDSAKRSALPIIGFPPYLSADMSKWWVSNRMPTWTPLIFPSLLRTNMSFKRILIVAAGPFFNILLALIIFFGIFQISGLLILKPSIGEVNEGTPAYRTGLEKGDLVVSIDGVKISSWEDMAKMITTSKGRAPDPYPCFAVIPCMSRTLRRNPKIFKNIFNEDIERYVIGITASGDFFTKDLNVFQALSQSFIQTYQITALTIKGCRKTFPGCCFAKNIGRSQ